MSKIRKDEIGLWCSVGGYVARPIGPTSFNEGESHKTHHVAGTTIAKIGKDKTCKRGQYLESWITTGIMSHEYEKYEQDYISMNYAWYVAECNRISRYEKDQILLSLGFKAGTNHSEILETLIHMKAK